MTKLLDGLLVLEFAQFMAGPWCGLRLADMGATVIKVERPRTGEAGRALATKNMYVDGDSLVAHTVNRNKLSFAANLKDPHDVAQVLADPQVRARNMVVQVQDPDTGPLSMAGNPIKMSAFGDPATRGAVPDLDGDREAVLRLIDETP